MTLNLPEQSIAVIGLGYVGLPLAVAFGRVHLPVVGIDVDEHKIALLKEGKSYIPDVPADQVVALVKQGLLRAGTDYDAVRNVDSIFICVPTPFDANKAPDLTAVKQAAASIAPRLQRGQMVVLQSTTYPGTTEEVVQPILETSGLKAGLDFDLAFSPERIDPGQINSAGYTVENTPKVVGGVNERSTRRAADLLKRIGAPVEIVSSTRAAEMSKLLENIFRSVNIALVNEMALLCERMGIDIWEVIRAASTKPFGFMPFTPGAGVGGHCIPVDPLYLSWKAREFDFHTNFIDLAAQVNQSMPFHIVDLAAQGLARQRKSLSGARVLVLGVAFKRDIDDARESPAERIIELLLMRGAWVDYHDPYISRFHIGGNVFHRDLLWLESVPLSDEMLSGYDCVVIVTGHRRLDYTTVVAHSQLVIDSCNATGGMREPHEKIVRLGAPTAVEA